MAKARKEMATYFTLNTGARIPSVGLGTYKAGPGVVGDLIAAAVKVLSTPPKPFLLRALLHPRAVPSLFCSQVCSVCVLLEPWP